MPSNLNRRLLAIESRIRPRGFQCCEDFQQFDAELWGSHHLVKGGETITAANQDDVEAQEWAFLTNIATAELAEWESENG